MTFVCLLAVLLLGGITSCTKSVDQCTSRLNDLAQQLQIVGGQGTLGTPQAEDLQVQLAKTLVDCQTVVGLEAGFSANDPFPHGKNAYTMLDLATMANNQALVREFVEKGVSIRGLPGWEANHVYSESTTFHVAAMYGADKAMEALLKTSTDISLQDRLGRTALMYVPGYFEGGRRTTSLLLEHGVNLEVLDKDGRSALAHAVRRNDAPKVRMLLAHGAHVDVRLDGISLMEYATKHGQEEIVTLLGH